MIHPSLVRKRSEGADVCPRFIVARRLGRITCCSTSVGLLKATAVRSSAPSTFWPRPLFSRAMSAASVPNAATAAVPQSTPAPPPPPAPPPRPPPPPAATTRPLDAAHVGAEIRQQRRTVRPGDVPPEVENPDPGENVAHRSLTLAHGAPLRRVAHGTGRRAMGFLSGRAPASSAAYLDRQLAKDHHRLCLRRSDDERRRQPTVERDGLRFQLAPGRVKPTRFFPFGRRPRRRRERFSWGSSTRSATSRGGEPRRLWQRAPPGTLRGLDRREPPGLGPDGSREGPVLLNVLWCLRALHDGAGRVIAREVDQRCREVHGHPVLAALLPRLADFRARDLDLLDAARPPRAPELVALGLEAGVLLWREPIVRPAHVPPRDATLDVGEDRLGPAGERDWIEARIRLADVPEPALEIGRTRRRLDRRAPAALRPAFDPRALGAGAAYAC